MTTRDRVLHASVRRFSERYEIVRRETLSRQAWLESLLAAWNPEKYSTLGKFLRSRAGRPFRRRQYLVQEAAAL